MTDKQSNNRVVVALHTLGCKANQADSTYLQGLLHQRGYEVVGFNDTAEYYILNTCTVTDQADREARQMIRRAKRNNPRAQVIVTGCYAQTQRDEVALLESVDYVVGNVEKDQIPYLLPSFQSLKTNEITCDRWREQAFRPSQKTQLKVCEDDRTHPETSRIRQQTEITNFGLSHHTKNTRAFVKIQDGCDKFCSFCIVPFARGNNRSVEPQLILDELHKLRFKGFEEAVLTGIHIGSYNHDRGVNLFKLLQWIDKEKPLPRIRLSSLDPEELSDDIIHLVADSNSICPHFHIAVQSGDNDILDRMRRHYHVDCFYKVIDKIRATIPNAAIGTDIIVGFPGETEEQFERSLRMIEELPLAYVHVFPFSKRRGTAAARYEGNIDNVVKKERTAHILKIGRQKKTKYYESFMGQSLEVIVESKKYLGGEFLKGVTRNYIPIYFQGENAYYRKRLHVVINKVMDTKVYGHVIS